MLRDWRMLWPGYNFSCSWLELVVDDELLIDILMILDGG